jgi:GT2 family glycosyltransferase
MGDQTAVIVVDNQSRDDSVEVAVEAGAQVVKMAINAGYAVACNEGSRAVGSTVEWIGFVNPDVLLTADDLRELTTDVPQDIWAVAPLTTTRDGKPQADVARPFPTAWFVAAMYMGLTRSKAPVADLADTRQGRYYYTEALSGSCLFVRRQTLESIGGWDDAFFFNCEDIDICLRIAKAGGRLAIDRSVRVTHHKAHSSATVDEEGRRLECARAYVTYFHIHGSRWQTALVASSAYVGCLLRRLLDPLRPVSHGSSRGRYGRLLTLFWISITQKFRRESPTRPAVAAFLDR